MAELMAMSRIIAHPFDRPILFYSDSISLKKYLDKNQYELDFDLSEVYGMVDKLKNSKTEKYKIFFFINNDQLKGKSTSFKLSTIAHESVHAAIAVLSIAGVPISEENEETLAYMTDYIFSRALKAFKID